MDELPDLNPREEGCDDDPVGSACERKKRVAAMRAAVERGLEDVREGRVTDLDEALARIETMLDEIDAIKRG